jgi:hypothetical protein
MMCSEHYYYERALRDLGALTPLTLLPPLDVQSLLSAAFATAAIAAADSTTISVSFVIEWLLSHATELDRLLALRLRPGVDRRSVVVESVPSPFGPTRVPALAALGLFLYDLCIPATATTTSAHDGAGHRRTAAAHLDLCRIVRAYATFASRELTTHYSHHRSPFSDIANAVDDHVATVTEELLVPAARAIASATFHPPTLPPTALRVLCHERQLLQLFERC